MQHFQKLHNVATEMVSKTISNMYFETALRNKKQKPERNNLWVRDICESEATREIRWVSV